MPPRDVRWAMERYPEDRSRPGDQSRLVSSGYRSIARPGRWPGRHRLGARVWISGHQPRDPGTCV